MYLGSKNLVVLMVPILPSKLTSDYGFKFSKIADLLRKRWKKLFAIIFWQ